LICHGISIRGEVTYRVNRPFFIHVFCY
jgi:hypothetical protein